MFGSGVSAGGGGSGGGSVSPRATGWGYYQDTQYTSVIRRRLAQNARVLIPNNALVKDESQLPEDMATFYNQSTGRILATLGSDYIISVRLHARPSNEVATKVTLELQVGESGSEVVIAVEQQTLPWGMQLDNTLNFTLSGYAMEAFATTGASLFITPDGPLDIFDISYVIKRTHKGV